MATRTIWLVEGSCGEYSDAQQWSVAAYEDEAMAREHARLGKLRADQLYAGYEDPWEMPTDANQYDEDMKADYTHTNSCLSG